MAPPTTSQWPQEPIRCTPIGWTVSGADSVPCALRDRELAAQVSSWMAACPLSGIEAEGQKQDSRALRSRCDWRGGGGGARGGGSARQRLQQRQASCLSCMASIQAMVIAVLSVLGSPGTPGPQFLASGRQRIEGRHPEINCVQGSLIKGEGAPLEG